MTDALRARLPASEDVALLRHRAAELARRGHAERRTETYPAVVFALGEERYALDARSVHEVILLRELTPLPGAQPPLFGLTHWRGRVLAVLDMRDALGVRLRGVTDLSRLIVVDAPRRPFGILADTVPGMVDVNAGLLRPLQRADDATGGLLAGVLDDLTLVIDADALKRRFAVDTTDG